LPVFLFSRDFRLTPVSRRFSVEDVLTARAQIMIGADDIRVRHTAQQSGPEYLAIAATSHFEVRLTQHFHGGPCAGCAHPYYNELDDSLIPTLATVSFWAGLQLALFVLARACGSEIPRTIPTQPIGHCDQDPASRAQFYTTRSASSDTGGKTMPRRARQDDSGAELGTRSVRPPARAAPFRHPSM
jgi:hypothetical protein